MKANKVTVSIRIESLSIDVLRGMLAEVIEHVEREIENGSLRMSDGDQVEWSTERKEVQF